MDVGPKSELFMLALRYARDHKHEQQLKHRCDLGDRPILEWFHNNWRCWFRERWIEHLTGKKNWAEFGSADFNLVSQKNFVPNVELVARIIGNLNKHRDNASENLGIILTAVKTGQDMGDVMAILQRLDINGKRPDCDEDGLHLFCRALQEADRYKYLESQKAGRDLGEAAIKDWFERFYDTFDENRSA